METNIIITQDSDITDTEIENLRSSVGWDNKTGPFSILKPRLFTYFTARENDRLVGFIDVLSDGIADSYLQDLMVHPEYQKKGIGSELMRRAITFLKNKNIKCIQVTFNPEFEPFYSKFGFYIFCAGIIDRDTMKAKLLSAVSSGQLQPSPEKKMRIDHIALWSDDIERLKEFYCTYFNARPNQKYENGRKQFQSYFLSFDNGSRLELMQMPDIPDNLNDPAKQYRGLIHIAIAVGSEQQVLELTRKLKNDGYEIVSEPRRTCDGYFESCVLDPDRNRVEIIDG